MMLYVSARFSVSTWLEVRLAQVPASPKYQKMTPTAPTTAGNNAVGQHIGGIKLGTCHHDGISWSNCSGLSEKEECLLVPGRAHLPLFLDCLSPTTRSRARLVFSLYLQSSSSVGNCGKGSLFNYRQFRVSENIFKSQVYGQTYILFKCFKDSSFPES